MIIDIPTLSDFVLYGFTCWVLGCTPAYLIHIFRKGVELG